MKERKRTKTSGLVSHTTPNGSYPSEESKLRKKFELGTITKEEMRKLASFIVVAKKKVQTINPKEVKIWGKWTPIGNMDVEMLKSQNFEMR